MAEGSSLLREAASLMRARAEDAAHLTPPWSVSSPRGSWDGYTIDYTTDNPDAGLLAQCADYLGLGAADHIASWHPAVALAVADWLDQEAAIWERIEETRWIASPKGISVEVGMSTHAESIAVARAYLNREDA